MTSGTMSGLYYYPGLKVCLLFYRLLIQLVLLSFVVCIYNHITLLYFVQLESLEELYKDDQSVGQDVAHQTVEGSALQVVELSANKGVEHGMVPFLAPVHAEVVC